MGSSRAPKVSATSNKSRSVAKPAPAPRAARRTNTGFVPGATPRRSAKAADSGALSEHNVVEGLKATGIDVRRLPGIRGARLNGRRLFPDASATIDGLERYGVHLREPEIRGRARYNTTLEIKSQRVAGSAERKIPQAIEDLAHHSDVTGTPCGFVLDTPVFTRADIMALKAKGAMHSVAVLTFEEARNGGLEAAIHHVARQRRNMARRLDSRGRYTPTKAFLPHEKGFMLRLAERNLLDQMN